MHNCNEYCPARALTLLLVVLALAGCALAGRSAAPEMATYALQNTAGAIRADGAASHITLRVAMPVAAPEFASARIAYIEQPYRIDYFAQHTWADTPPRMLKPLLTQRLTDSGLFGFVFSDSAGIDETVRLDTSIIELVQTFTPSASEVRVSIRFDLVDVERRTVLLSRTISITEPATQRDPYAGVVAANLGVQRALDELIALLRDPVAALSARTSASGSAVR